MEMMLILTNSRLSAAHHAGGAHHGRALPAGALGGLEPLWRGRQGLARGLVDHRRHVAVDCVAGHRGHRLLRVQLRGEALPKHQG